MKAIGFLRCKVRLRNIYGHILMTTLIVIILFCPEVAKGSYQDTTKVGVYITSIYDLDYTNNSFSVHYLTWRLNKSREFKEYNSYEPANAKEIRKVFSSTEWKDQSENVITNLSTDTVFWDVDEFKAIFNHEFDISKYPFDEEILTMDFVSAYYYDNWVKLNFDSVESGLDDIKIDGWEVGDFHKSKISKVYKTTFGSPGDDREHVYSGFRISIPIKRNGVLLFFKLFTGLIVSFVIALFSLKINIAEADGRFGVCVGALFAALANMYIVNSNLPLVSQFSFMDQAHMIAIFLILVLFISSVYSLKYYKKKNKSLSKKIDKYVFHTVWIVYVVLNSIILIIALN